MDRLFSKLQLGDIKVGEKSNYPPDTESEQYQERPADGHAADTMTATAPVAPAAALAEAAPDVAPAQSASEDHVVSVSARPYRPGYGQGVPQDRGEILKVSSRSRPSAVAGAIAGVMRENGRVEVQAIGAGAANQAIKAVAIARDYLNETGIEAICLPSLIDLTIDEADRTAIRLVIETR